jgi:hypothetical protein
VIFHDLCDNYVRCFIAVRHRFFCGIAPRRNPIFEDGGRF